MPEAVIVSLETVIRVLKAHKIEVSQIFSADGSPMPHQFALAKGDHGDPDHIYEILVIKAPITKKLLNYFAWKYKVPIHHFYNPLMAPTSPEEPIQ